MPNPAGFCARESRRLMAAQVIDTWSFQDGVSDGFTNRMVDPTAGVNWNFGIVRLSKTGAPDTSWATGGLVDTTFAASGTPAEETFALVLQPDARLVAAGNTDAGGTGNQNDVLARCSLRGPESEAAVGRGILLRGGEMGTLIRSEPPL
jgi:hypothetical protein